MEGVADSAEGEDRFRAEGADRFRGRDVFGEGADRFRGRDVFGEPSITLQLKPAEKGRGKIGGHLASPLE
ncbi:hypothetical protein CsSME_00009506 [Camellia sinensis var. sinensis]